MEGRETEVVQEDAEALQLLGEEAGYLQGEKKTNEKCIQQKFSLFYIFRLPPHTCLPGGAGGGNLGGGPRGGGPGGRPGGGPGGGPGGRPGGGPGGRSRGIGALIPAGMPGGLKNGGAPEDNRRSL